MKRLAPSIALALALASAPAARAQTAEEAAQALFAEGRTLVDHGDWDKACPKFAESLRLVDRPSTRLNVAQCEERQGKLVRALADYKRALDALPPEDERAKLARDRIAALGRRIAHVTIDLTTPATGVQVTIDDLRLEAQVPRDLPADPGEHTCTVVAPGFKPKTIPLSLAEAETKQISVTLEVDPDAGGPGPVDTSRADSMRTAGFIAGGAGVLGVGVGVVTGIVILGKKSSADADCKGGHCDLGTPDGRRGRSTIDGMPPLMITNGVAWGVGIAGLGAGAALLFLASRQQEPARVGWSLGAGPGGASASLRVGF